MCAEGLHFSAAFNCVVLQQDEVIAELKEYARINKDIPDGPEVELVIDYLEALNKLFEKSLLGQHTRVFTAEGSTIQRMADGFQFFVNWAKESFEGDDKKTFLAWQV